MTDKFLIDDNWDLIVETLGGAEELQRSAKISGALVRARKIKDAEGLLRLCLAYGPGHKSLRSSAAWAEAAHIASLSDVAVLKRLRNCSDWLETLVSKALCDLKMPDFPLRPIRLVDGSLVSKKDKSKGSWRIHSVYDLQEKRFSFLKVTDDKMGERFDMAPVIPGEIRIGDRAFMQAERIGKILGAGGDILVRSGWNRRWLDDQGEKIDLIELLKATRKAGKQILDRPMLVGRSRSKKVSPLPLRLVALRKPKEARLKSEKAARRIAQKNGNKISPNTLEAAGWFILVTSLDENEFPPETLFKLYRLRWQIELAFKRLKSLLGTKQPPAKDEKLAKVFILSHLLLAVIMMPTVEKLRDSFP